MKRIFTLLACIGALLLTACTSDSSLPTPSGKGTVRAINAIPGSPEVRFLIEERSIGSMRYSQSTAPIRFDDFEYNFNFEALIFGSGDLGLTRVATQVHKVEANRDHIFVLTGDPLSPTVIVWNSDIREFGTDDTVFEMRLAHMIDSLSDSDVDVYVDEFTEPQVVANRVATLSWGDISVAQDLAGAEYVITVTEAGDVDAVLYSSNPIIISSQVALVGTLFDGNANDTSEIVIDLTGSTGFQRRLSDETITQTVRFVHASYPLTTVDIFDDDLLTNMIFSGLGHGEATGDIPVSGDIEEYFWTPTASTATILFQESFQAPLGARTQVIVFGNVDEWTYFPYVPDRAPVSLYAKVQVFQSSLDNEQLDLYVVDADETIAEDDLPFALVPFTPHLTAQRPLAAGSYDFYLTLNGDNTPIAPPLRIDAADGDVIELLILDTMDTAVPEIRVLPAP